MTADVLITLADRELVLKPTVRAALALSKKHNGLQNVLARIANVELEAILDVIEVGSNFKGDKLQLQEAVFSAGVIGDTESVVVKCVDYVHVLMRGGRPLAE